MNVPRDGCIGRFVRLWTASFVLVLAGCASAAPVVSTAAPRHAVVVEPRVAWPYRLTEVQVAIDDVLLPVVEFDRGASPRTVALLPMSGEAHVVAMRATLEAPCSLDGGSHEQLEVSAWWRVRATGRDPGLHLLVRSLAPTGLPRERVELLAAAQDVEVRRGAPAELPPMPECDVLSSADRAECRVAKLVGHARRTGDRALYGCATEHLRALVRAHREATRRSVRDPLQASFVAEAEGYAFQAEQCAPASGPPPIDVRVVNACAASGHAAAAPSAPELGMQAFGFMLVDLVQ